MKEKNEKKENDYVYRMLLEPKSRFNEIISLIANSEDPITLDVVAEKLNMAKKTAANNLSMLVKTGLIKRVKKNKYIIPPENYTFLKLILMLYERFLNSKSSR